jgi:hypothetical protein
VVLANGINLGRDEPAYYCRRRNSPLIRISMAWGLIDLRIISSIGCDFREKSLVASYR